MTGRRLVKLPVDYCRSRGLPTNPTYWRHYVDTSTNQLHIVVDLDVAYSFIVGDHLVITDRRTMEQVGRIPIPPDEPGGVYEECPGCGKFHKAASD
jgi:hypothetical protein